MNNIRDKELTRVKQYAQALGIKVLIKKQGPEDPEADWALDGSQITVYLRPKQSKTQIILDLIHELGHHQEWVYRGRKTPLKIDTALSRETPTKAQRKHIYDDEVNGAAYQLLIYKEIGLTIPKWKVEVERDLSLASYRYFWLNGDHPTREWRREKRKELIKKYKKED
jgi:hypothetical protein